MKQMSKRFLSWLPTGLKEGRVYREQTSFLQRAQHWSADSIRAWQTAQFLDLLRHAWAHTEGYRELYHRAGAHLDDIRTLDDMRYLPTVTKPMLQDNLEAFSVQVKGRRYTTTGGSTGIPFGFYLGPHNRAIELAYQHTAWGWSGWKPRFRSVVLRGGVVGSQSHPWEHDPYRRRLNMTTAYLTPETLPDYLDAIGRYRPQTLQAYPSACLMLTDLLEEHDRPVNLPFRFIMLGSENLYDWQIEKFSRAFPQAKLVSWYGHSEKAVLASWCEHSRTYHCWPFYGLTEVLDGQGREVSEGKQGQVVATSFHMQATPFIRYETMDRAEKGPPQCGACGRHFSVLNRIMGRMQEVIVTGDGRYISMTAMNMHSRIFDPLKQFQFLQEQPGAVVFRYVPKRPRLSLAQVRDIRRELQIKLGKDVKLRLQPMSEIPYTKRGKLCFLEQRLEVRYGDSSRG